MKLDDLTIKDLESLAARLYRARVFAKDVVSDDQGFSILLAGAELGFTPMAAVRSVSLVKGKVSLGADATMALCLRRRDVCEYFRCVSTTARAAKYVTRRIGSEPVELTYTIEQAQRAGLTNSPTWQAHPEAMLRARCGAALARLAYPDLVAGLYDPDEALEIAGHYPVAEARAPEAAASADPALPSPAVASQSAFSAFSADLGGCSSLVDVVACWHTHCRDLHASETEDAATARVADWLFDRGYVVTMTEQQAIVARGWPEEALRLADALAAQRAAVEVLRWYVAVRSRVEALPDPKAFKTLVARTWAKVAGVEGGRFGAAFAEALKAHEADSAPAIAPIVTSAGETLATAQDVANHIDCIAEARHLENTARKHGGHPWAVDPLVRRTAELLGVPMEAARAQVMEWAGAGPKVAPEPAGWGDFEAAVEAIELPGEAVSVWRKHRATLEAAGAKVKDRGWKALCDRTELVGKMKNAKVWLRKAVAEEDARAGQVPIVPRGGPAEAGGWQ